MVVFDCECEFGHVFEGLFDSSESLEMQLKAGLVSCPKCGSTSVKRLPSAPYVKSAKTEESLEGEVRRKLYQMASNLVKNSVYVGDDFAREARAIHEGRAPERTIHGKCTPTEVKALIEEGIGILPLPDDFGHEKN
ncbi:MAG TPA: DUF1178 domain-containing protein [Sutterella sp.]|nr:DUF1178 domain-containing protein [Sutterella sp.]